MLRLEDEIDLAHWRTLSSGLPSQRVSAEFPTEKDCEDWFSLNTWPEGCTCPKCAVRRVWFLETRNLIQCSGCDHHFSARSVSRLRGRRVSLRSCFLGAEFIIETTAAGKHHIQTIERFQKIVDLSYRPARSLRIEMFEELKKPLGGFWGGLVCINEMDETHYIENRLDELLEYHGFGDIE